MHLEIGLIKPHAWISWRACFGWWRRMFLQRIESGIRHFGASCWELRSVVECLGRYECYRTLLSDFLCCHSERNNRNGRDEENGSYLCTGTGNAEAKPNEQVVLDSICWVYAGLSAKHTVSMNICNQWDYSHMNKQTQWMFTFGRNRANINFCNLIKVQSCSFLCAENYKFWWIFGWALSRYRIFSRGNLRHVANMCSRESSIVRRPKKEFNSRMLHSVSTHTIHTEHLLIHHSPASNRITLNSDVYLVRREVSAESNMYNFILYVCHDMKKIWLCGFIW